MSGSRSYGVWGWWRFPFVHLYHPIRPYLVSAAQCHAEQIVHVGDRLEGDIRGAQLAAIFPEALSSNMAYRPSEALENFRAIGPPLDVSDWRYRKRIEITRGGVQQVELGLEVLAHASDTLSDLRLLREGNQIPYILNRTSETRHFSPEAVSTVDPKRPRVSVWTVTLPYASLPITRITCTTSSPYFKRDVKLFEERPDKRGNLHRACLATATWLRTSDRTDAPLILNLSEKPVSKALFLEIENGDNRQLDLMRFLAWYAVPRMLFHSEPDSDVFLYYGNRSVRAPRYDLALVREKLLAEEKVDPILNAEEELKPGSDWALASVSTGVVFWSVLALVVVGLLYVLARLLPKPES